VRGILVRALLIVVIAAGAGVAAYAFSKQQPHDYTAVLKFAYGRLVAPELAVLSPNLGDPQIDENVRIQTEAAQLDSFDVAVATSKAAPELGTPGRIAAAVAVGAVRDTLTIDVTATADTPQKAARLANLYGQQYLVLRRQQVAARSKRVVKGLKARLRGLTRDQRKSLPGASLRDQINVEQTLGRLGTGEPLLFQEARPSFAPRNDQTSRNVLFGLVFGLVVGIGLVALRTETTRRSDASVGRVPARGPAPRQ
jgi:hypothetical protein